MALCKNIMIIKRVLCSQEGFEQTLNFSTISFQEKSTRNFQEKPVHCQLWLKVYETKKIQYKKLKNARQKLTYPVCFTHVFWNKKLILD